LRDDSYWLLLNRSHHSFHLHHRDSACSNVSKKTPSSPRGDWRTPLSLAVLFLRPVGNAVVPLSDGALWAPLPLLLYFYILYYWKHYATISRISRPYTWPSKICQCLSLASRIAERDRRDDQERDDSKFGVQSSENLDPLLVPLALNYRVC
jgi:hypothetical protein